MRYLYPEYSYLFPLLLSAIFCLKAFRQKWPKPYRLYASMVIVTLFTELLAINWPYELRRYFHTSWNNFWIYNLFMMVRFGLLSAIFYQVLTLPAIKKVLPTATTVILVFSMIEFIFIHGPLQYNTYSLIITHVCIITLCLLHFRQLLQEPVIITLRKEPIVWLTVSVFFYHAVALPFLISLSLFDQNDTRLADLFLPINDVLNFSLCTCYLISFLWKPQYSQPH